jgi:hypothetical protein
MLKIEKPNPPQVLYPYKNIWAPNGSRGMLGKKDKFTTSIVWIVHGQGDFRLCLFT